MNAMTRNPRSDAQIAIEGVRKRKVESTEMPEAFTVDHGAEGEAALARPRATQQVATGHTRQGREKADAVQYLDLDIWEHFRRSNVLTDRQTDAGEKLTELYQTGYSAMLALPSYGCRVGGALGEEEDEVRSKARRDYGKHADAIPHSARHAMACMVRGEHPTMMLWAQYVRSGCDAVAESMKMPRYTHER